MSVQPSRESAEAATRMQKIDQTLAGLETNWLNKFGYIPLGVSSTSGQVRILYAIAILVTAAVAATIQGLKASTTSLEDGEITGTEILKKYSLHALTNAGRGVVEIIVPTISLTGGVYLFLYDKFPTDIHETGKKEEPSIEFETPFKIPCMKKEVRLTFRQGLRMTYDLEKYDGRRINTLVESRLQASLKKRFPTYFAEKT